MNEEKVQACKKCDDFQSENNLIHAQVNEVTSQLTSKEEEYSSLISKHETLEAKLKSMEDNYSQQIEGFVEELNKMNVELKQRGETITRLEEQCQSNEKEFKVICKSITVFLENVILIFPKNNFFQPLVNRQNSKPCYSQLRTGKGKLSSWKVKSTVARPKVK